MPRAFVSWFDFFLSPRSVTLLRIGYMILNVFMWSSSLPPFYPPSFGFILLSDTSRRVNTVLGEKK